MRKILFVFSYPLCVRNFIHSGLLNECVKNGSSVSILSPYQRDTFEDAWGNKYQNTCIPSVGKDQWGTPLIEGAGRYFRMLTSLRMRGYSIEYPDGSLQTMELKEPTNTLWYASWLLIKLFPRRSAGRKLLRKIYDKMGPGNRQIDRVISTEKPDLVVTSTMGHLPIDFIALTVAKRHDVRTACVLLSWDNLYSRGPVYKHPDKLLVWSKMMHEQATRVHQFDNNDVKIVGPLQFVNYAGDLTTEELNVVRSKFSLEATDKYILFVCGGRTPQYDIEDIEAMLGVLRQSAYKNHKIIVRPHPQVNPRHYDVIKDRVLLDYSPEILDVDDPAKLFSRAEVRYMAALLSQADFVVSSWGTTALLEAIIFNKKVVQLNWFDSVGHADKKQREMVSNFQRYYHMIELDNYNGRLFSSSPSDLVSKFDELNLRDEYFTANRKRIRQDFTTGDYENVASRAARELI